MSFTETSTNIFARMLHAFDQVGAKFRRHVLAERYYPGSWKTARAAMHSRTGILPRIVRESASGIA